MKKVNNVLDTLFASSDKFGEGTVNEVHVIKHGVIKFSMDRLFVLEVLFNSNYFTSKPFEHSVRCIAVYHSLIHILIGLNVIAKSNPSLAVDPRANIGGVQLIVRVQNQVGMIKDIHRTASKLTL